jgi:cation transport ATPase
MLWMVMILAIILHFKVLQSVYKISALYEKMASFLLDPTAFQFYQLDQKLNQDSEKLQQYTVEKAMTTMEFKKSTEFVKKYQHYHQVKKFLDNAYFIYFVVYIFGLRPFFSFLHLTSWIWQLILFCPMLFYWFYPFYANAWKTLSNGRKLSIAMLSYTLKKVIKSLDSDYFVVE